MSGKNSTGSLKGVCFSDNVNISLNYLIARKCILCILKLTVGTEHKFLKLHKDYYIHAYFPDRVYSFPLTAVTNYYKLVSLK
jgi:hypothetical protein